MVFNAVERVNILALRKVLVQRTQARKLLPILGLKTVEIIIAPLQFSLSTLSSNERKIIIKWVPVNWETEKNEKKRKETERKKRKENKEKSNEKKRKKTKRKKKTKTK